MTEQTITLTGDQIPMFRLLTMKQAMKFELKTGIKMTRINVFSLVRNEFGIKARKKQAVYDQFCEMLTENGIEI